MRQHSERAPACLTCLQERREEHLVGLCGWVGMQNLTLPTGYNTALFSKVEPCQVSSCCASSSLLSRPVPVELAAPEVLLCPSFFIRSFNSPVPTAALTRTFTVSRQVVSPARSVLVSPPSSKAGLFYGPCLLSTGLKPTHPHGSCAKLC